MMYYYGNYFYPFHGIFMILFWVLVVWCIIWLVRKSDNSQQSQNQALDILKERYAKGEINREEFERMKKDIQ